MKSFEIKGTLRSELGKKDSKKLRETDEVPCVMYGGNEVLHFTASLKSFFGLVYTPHVYIVEIELEGKKYKAAMKEIQFHPVSEKIMHIDFVEVSDEKEVTIHIPIRVTGNSIGVKNGGKLRVRRRTLQVKALPVDLPDDLEIDVTKLNIGQSIRVGDLNYKNLKLTESPRSLILSIISSRVTAKGMAPVESEETEGEETAAAEEPAKE